MQFEAKSASDFVRRGHESFEYKLTTAYPNIAASLPSAHPRSMAILFHDLRAAMNWFWVAWHMKEPIQLLKSSLAQHAAAVLDLVRRLEGKQTFAEIDSQLLFQALLSGDRRLVQEVAQWVPGHQPADTYGVFYKAVAGVLKALVTNDSSELTSQLHEIQAKHNLIFYWPSKALIEAAAERDWNKLRKSQAAVAKKFDGYAAKCGAVRDGWINVRSLHDHYFWPYPDLALYIAATDRGYEPGKDSIWLPNDLLASYH